MDAPDARSTITGPEKINGLDALWLENSFLKVGVLIGRGADIFEFRYKPADLNFLLRIPGEIRNPAVEFAQRRDTHSQMEDYYYGGWQDCVPNSAPFVYRGAAYGQHGEVWGVPWKYEIESGGPDQVELKCWVRPMRTPLLVEKTLKLERGSRELMITSRITNEGRTPFDFIWGQHIAFGLPFLKEGARISTNASSMEAESAMPDKRIYTPGMKSKWPIAEDLRGKEMDASNIPPAGEQPSSDLAYLSGFGSEGFYSIENPSTNLGFGLKWDATLFKYLWLWQERYGIMDAPWWGRVYTVALEPWTARWTHDPEAGIKQGLWECLQPEEQLTTTVQASAIDKRQEND